MSDFPDSTLEDAFENNTFFRDFFVFLRKISVILDGGLIKEWLFLFLWTSRARYILSEDSR
jgi:hypothetical protein